MRCEKCHNFFTSETCPRCGFIPRTVVDRAMPFDENIEFFIVWNPAGDNPAMRHGTREKAQVEADRLARMNPGEEFYVLKAETMVEASAIRRTRFGECPF